MTDAREVIARAVDQAVREMAIRPMQPSPAEVAAAMSTEVLTALDAAGYAIVPKDAADQLAAAEARVKELEGDWSGLVAHLEHQRKWSKQTFGPDQRLSGVIDHIRKELAEIEADPNDIMEWVDVIILAFDGAWRAGWEPSDIVRSIREKQAINEARSWPDWRTADPDKAIEHNRKALKDQGGEDG